MSSLPDWYIPVFTFLFGLCFGSFLNVVALRGLSGEDIFISRSKCPKCGNKLKWFMNIPLVSYIFLRGKCAYCKTPISIQYPIVEFLTALFFLLMYLNFGFTFKALFMCIFTFFFILLALTDILETVILDYHAYILAGFGLLYVILGFSDITIVQSILGAVGGFLVFEILSKIGECFAKVRMFGEGDSLIALALGFIFGLKGLIIIVAISFIVQTVAAIPVLVINSFKEKKFSLAFTYLFILFSIVFIATINTTHIIKNYTVYLILVFTVCILLLFSLRVIFKEINAKKELFEKTDDFEEIIEKSTFHIMPFGPALIISAFICIFYLDSIKHFAINLIY